MLSVEQKLQGVDRKSLRIGVFYDGGFFYHVSNYYRYAHPRKKRISIPGLHEFIRHRAAELEGVDVRYSQIIDSHFFRGRFSAQQTQANNKLYAERAFNDVLMNEGVTTHYLPIFSKAEKGIDVWLSLEAFELAIYKRYNVLVLLAGDGDFVPLVRKLNTLGTRVMLPSWDFSYTDDQGRERTTVTSAKLIGEVAYPLSMHEIIDSAAEGDAPLLDNLFVESRPRVHAGEPTQRTPSEAETEPDDAHEGHILSLKEGFGFIACKHFPNNVFFHHSALENGEFEDLCETDPVVFRAKEDGRGPVAYSVELPNHANRTD